MYVIYLYKTFAKGGWGIKIRFNVTSYFICFSKKDASSKDHKRSPILAEEHDSRILCDLVKDLT